MNKSYKKSRYAKKRAVKNGKRTIRKKYKKRSRRTKSKGGGNGPSTAASTAASAVEERAAPYRDLLPFTPEWSRDVPTESPYLSFFSKLNQKRKAIWRKLRSEAPESPQDKRIWQEAVQRITDRYNERFKEKSIPEGTLLFHGSLDDRFEPFGVKVQPDMVMAPVFFGIEANISLWYIFEMATREWRRRHIFESAKKYFRRMRPHGYLYVYRVTKEIPKENIKFLPLLLENIRDQEECDDDDRPKMVCVHPQLAYRVFTSIFKTAYNDLTIELTLRPSEYSDSIEFVKQFRVDTNDLLKNEKNPSYSSLHSISDWRKTLDGPWEPISKEKE